MTRRARVRIRSNMMRPRVGRGPSIEEGIGGESGGSADGSNRPFRVGWPALCLLFGLSGFSLPFHICRLQGAGHLSSRYRSAGGCQPVAVRRWQSAGGCHPPTPLSQASRTLPPAFPHPLALAPHASGTIPFIPRCSARQNGVCNVQSSELVV